MLSATFSGDIQMLAKDFLKEYIILSVGGVVCVGGVVARRLGLDGRLDRKDRGCQ